MKIKEWWEGRTMNEKLMWGLIAALCIGIFTRWGYVWGEIADAFGAYFE